MRHWDEKSESEDRVTSEIKGARDIASNLGELNAQPMGDDTTDIGTSTVATNFGILFQQFMMKLHLSEAKS